MKNCPSICSPNKKLSKLIGIHNLGQHPNFFVLPLTSHEQPTHISTQVHLSFEYNCLFKGGGKVQCFFVLRLKDTKRKIVDHSKQFVAICLFNAFAFSQILGESIDYFKYSIQLYNSIVNKTCIYILF